MAAAAEQIQSYLEIPADNYLSVDESFFLAGIRTAARQEAVEIIEQRRESLRQADYDAVPLPVDALSSAHAVIRAKEQYGEQSQSAHEAYRGLKLDCQRLLAEAARKNTYEYFPPLRQTYDAERSEYTSHGFSILDMTAAALTPIAEPEELERRINERVEEVTYQALGRLALGERMLGASDEVAKAQSVRRIRTISECPDWAIEAYDRQSKAGFGGYVPEIQKFMVRDVVFDPVTGDRYEEQVGLPGLHISHEVITSVLETRGVSGAKGMTKTELQGLQLEADDELLDFVQVLDEAATAVTGQNLFMGEPTERAKNYQSIPVAAQTRQAALEAQASSLADKIIDLAEADTDRWLANKLVGDAVKEIMFAIACQDINQAADIFDQPTAAGLREVFHLRQIGDLATAQSRLEQVEASAPAPSYCGAGSCGLENVGVSSKEASAMKEMGLDSAGSLKDTVRRCPKCSKKDIVYDLKNKKKACTSCKTTTGFGKSSK